MSMDTLVELFLQSARPEEQADLCQGPSFPGGAPDKQAIEKGIRVVEQLMTTEDAINMGGSPSATFVLMGMGLAEKPSLGEAAIRCYEKGLEYLTRRTGKDTSSWEHCVLLQQLGTACQGQGHFQAADRWLEECAHACNGAPGHPRDACLFSGAFTQDQTRLQFATALAVLRAQNCLKLGNTSGARVHAAEAKRLEGEACSDAVERQAAVAPQTLGEMESAARAAVAAQTSGAMESAAIHDSPTDMWLETPSEVQRLTEYRYVDEGPTVLLILELNEHLGLGVEASEAVQALRQFRVVCHADCVDVQLRLRRRSGQLWHFKLLLQPLRRAIIPEDTVPKLRGKEGKRRLEVMLFKQEKQMAWVGDILKDRPRKAKAGNVKAKGGTPPLAEVVEQPVRTLENPLAPEELARLPTPSETRCDNKPSTWHGGSSTAGLKEADAGSAKVAVASGLPTTLPDWVAELQERYVADAFEVLVRLGEMAGETVSMQDLDLTADPLTHQLRLSLPRAAPAAMLEIRVPEGVDLEGLTPKWRRKARELELKMPLRPA